jgi:hypothetical protein
MKTTKEILESLKYGYLCVSEGTLRTEDLADSIIDAADYLEMSLPEVDALRVSLAAYLADPDAWENEELSEALAYDFDDAWTAVGAALPDGWTLENDEGDGAFFRICRYEDTDTDTDTDTE